MKELQNDDELIIWPEVVLPPPIAPVAPLVKPKPENPMVTVGVSFALTCVLGVIVVSVVGYVDDPARHPAHQQPPAAVSPQICASGQAVTSIDPIGQVTCSAFEPALRPAVDCGAGAWVSGSDYAGVVLTGADAFGCTLQFSRPWVTTPSCFITGDREPREWITTESSFTFWPASHTSYQYVCDRLRR